MLEDALAARCAVSHRDSGHRRAALRHSRTAGQRARQASTRGSSETARSSAAGIGTAEPHDKTDPRRVAQFRILARRFTWVGSSVPKPYPRWAGESRIVALTPVALRPSPPEQSIMLWLNHPTFGGQSCRSSRLQMLDIPDRSCRIRCQSISERANADRNISSVFLKKSDQRMGWRDQIHSSLVVAFNLLDRINQEMVGYWSSVTMHRINNMPHILEQCRCPLKLRQVFSGH